MADNKIYITKVVGDDPMMSSTTADLGNSIYFLKFVTKASELLRSDILNSLYAAQRVFLKILTFLRSFLNNSFIY